MTDTDQYGSSPSTDVKDTAKEQAQSVAATTKDEAANVVDTAKEQAQAVASDLREQTRQLTDEARSQLTDHAFAQRDNAVESLRSIGDELTGMAEQAESPGIGAQLTREVGGYRAQVRGLPPGARAGPAGRGAARSRTSSPRLLPARCRLRRTARRPPHPKRQERPLVRFRERLG